MQPITAPKGLPERIPGSDLLTILSFYANKNELLQEKKVNFDPAEIRDQKLLVFIMHYTGMRQSSILKLKWEQIDFDNNIIIAENVKGKRPFYFPLHNKLRALLGPIKQASGRIVKRKDRRMYFWDRDLKKMIKENKIAKKYQMYQLRDTFVSICAGKEIDIAVIQELTNHSKQETLRNNYWMIDVERYRKLLNEVDFV